MVSWDVARSEQSIDDGSDLVVECLHIAILLEDLIPHQDPVRLLRELASLEAASLERCLGHVEHVRIGGGEVGDRKEGLGYAAELEQAPASAQ